MESICYQVMCKTENPILIVCACECFVGSNRLGKFLSTCSIEGQGVLIQLNVMVGMQGVHNYDRVTTSQQPTYVRVEGKSRCGFSLSYADKIKEHYIPCHSIVIFGSYIHELCPWMDVALSQFSYSCHLLLTPVQE